MDGYVFHVLLFPGHGWFCLPRPTESVAWLWKSPIEVRSTIDVTGWLHGSCGLAGRRGAVDIGSVPVRDRLRHLCHKLLEQRVALCLDDVQPPPLTADGAGTTHGLVHRTLLIHEGRILYDHHRDDILVRLLVIDLALRESVLLDELQVVLLLIL